MMRSKLSHLTAANQAGMVDVSAKAVTRREAAATAIVRLPAAVTKLFRGGEYRSPKGPVFQTARLAGIQAVKQTANLIPLCHPLPVEGIDFEIRLDGDRVRIRCAVRVTHKTGVEMEALTGASVAALTVYDMCKAVSHNLVIERVRLEQKSGGRRDFSRESSP